MYELLALKFWKFPGRQCLMDSFFLLFNISGQIAYRKKSEISDFTFILDMLGLARTESDWVGYWKKSGIDGIVGDWRLVNMKRNILFGDLLSFCSCFNVFCLCCFFVLSQMLEMTQTCVRHVRHPLYTVIGSPSPKLSHTLTATQNM